MQSWWCYLIIAWLCCRVEESSPKKIDVAKARANRPQSLTPIWCWTSGRFPIGLMNSESAEPKDKFLSHTNLMLMSRVPSICAAWLPVTLLGRLLPPMLYRFTKLIAHPELLICKPSGQTVNYLYKRMGPQWNYVTIDSWICKSTYKWELSFEQF